MDIAGLYSKALEKTKPHMGRFGIFDPASIIMKWVRKHPEDAEKLARDLYAVLQECFKEEKID